MSKERKNIKVLMLLSNAFDPDPRVYQEAKALIKHGYEITIIAWDRDYKHPVFEKIEGINVERIYVSSTHGRGTTQIFFLFVFWLKAFFKILRKNFAVVHCHDFDTLPLGFLAGKIKRKKIIYDAHESYVDMLNSNVNNYLKKIILSIENFLIKRIDSLITVGDMLKKAYEMRGARNICIVGNWKSLEHFKIPKEKIQNIKKQLKIPDNRLIISFITWLSAERQLAQLLESVINNKNVFLILGGDGPMRNQVEHISSGADNIIFLGFVNPKYIALYTCMADVIFYGFDKDNPNSKYSAPNKLFEALAAGKAIVCGNFGEIGKIVKKERCGIILKKYSTLEIDMAFNFLIQKEKLREFQRNALIAGTRKYNWEKAQQKLLNGYLKIL